MRRSIRTRSEVARFGLSCALAVCFLPVVVLAGWTETIEDATVPLGKVIAWRKIRVGNPASTSEATLQLVVFDSRRHRLGVWDQESKVHGKHKFLAAAMADAGAVAGVNGGYFHPDFRPVGMVVSGGVRKAEFQRAKLLSGVVAATNSRIYLMRANEFLASKIKPRDALQAGPFVVDAYAKTKGLSTTRPRRRTFVLTDGKYRFAIGSASHLSLAQLGALLSTANLLDFRVKRALNLDGGSSSGIWIRRPKPENPLYIPEFARVRNFVYVVGR